MKVWVLAYNNLVRRKIRTVLTVSGIGIAVFVLISLLGFDKGYQESLTADIDKMGYQVLITAKGCPYEAATLMLKGGDDSESAFYDPGDWIDKETAGVPVNKARIAPGETGEIKFTLDPRNVRPATYKLVFSMNLRNTGETVYLNGDKTWEMLIRVDK